MNSCIRINGGFNNLSSWEAAQLVSVIKPKVIIPCHYDMFPDNSVNHSQFRAALKVQSPDTGYWSWHTVCLSFFPKREQWSKVKVKKIIHVLFAIEQS
jgi:L-ascorbate metabolism protein UlaG (beta-lactamase superfamily)